CRRTRPGNRPADYALGEAPLSERAARIASDQQACEYFEAPLTQQDCFSCGACCHRGFDVVEVAPREMFAKKHPELIQARSNERYVVPRPEGRCVALTGNGCAEMPYLCQHYEERPRSCRDFAVGGDACLIARQ